MNKFVLTLMAILMTVLIINPLSAQLADSSWPKTQCDNKNTGRTSYFGSLVTDLNWTFQTSQIIASSAVVGSDGTIYFGCNDQYMYALNADGTVKWSYKTNKNISSAAAVAQDGSIYFGSNDGYIYGVNANGTGKWNAKLGGAATGSPVIGDDGTIYMGSGTVYFAFNPNGSIKWSYLIGTSTGTQSALSDDGVLYFCSHRSLGSINVDGSFNWYFTPPTGEGGTVSQSTPTIGADGTIYYGDTAGFFRAVRPDKTQLWLYQAGDAIYSSPAICEDGTIYFGCDDGILYALNPDGSTKWKFPTGESVYSAPAIGADGTIYIASVDDIIYAINPDGSLNWSYASEDDFTTSPAISPTGAILIGSYDRKFYSIGWAEQGTGEPPEVDIYANKTNIGATDPVIISVKVDNKSNSTVDMYAAVMHNGALYFYPTWDLNPTAEAHKTAVAANTIWDNPILWVPFFIKKSGTFTFYAAIAEGGTFEILQVDGVTVNIQ